MVADVLIFIGVLVSCFINTGFVRGRTRFSQFFHWFRSRSSCWIAFGNRILFFSASVDTAADALAFTDDGLITANGPMAFASSPNNRTYRKRSNVASGSALISANGLCSSLATAPL